MLSEPELCHPPRCGRVDIALDQPWRILAERRPVIGAAMGMKMEVVIRHSV
jgi:hypothetical protein